MYEITSFDCRFDLEPQRRASIVALEEHIKQMPQADMPVEHYFADGLYGRALHIPKHCVLTGAIHKREHINVLIKGSITVVTEDGVRDFTAPSVIVSKPGTKRVGFAHEDSIWLTVHACEATDVETAEQELVTNSFVDYERFLEESKCLLQSPAPSLP